MSDSKAAKATAKALRQSNNEWTNKYFAIALGAIMVLFAIHHWLHVIHFHYGPRKSYPAPLARLYRYLPTISLPESDANRCHKKRKTRRFLSTSWIGIRTDRSLLYIVYWSINLILALTNVDLTSITYVS